MPRSDLDDIFVVDILEQQRLELLAAIRIIVRKLANDPSKSPDHNARPAVLVSSVCVMRSILSSEYPSFYLHNASIVRLVATYILAREKRPGSAR